uniref:Reverse transcriptase domain-containing protein n=1 Tax=Bursaphelenchus xylophilus TaxID=6326 RepID=A0A1I7SJ48_BURXY
MRSRMTPMATKRKSWHVCVLPAFLYGSEAWALTKSSETKLVRCQRRMERHMLCHRLVDRVPNATIRDRTKLKDVIQEARKRKWKFAKKIVEGDQERWEARLLNWKPDTKRPLGRPRTRRRLQELLQV